PSHDRVILLLSPSLVILIVPTLLYLFFFFFHCSVHHRDLHSFPTRRSSDLIPEVVARHGLVDDGDMWFSLVSTGVFRSEVTTKRSEEHTSELQSRFDLVCRLLLEKKKKKKKKKNKCKKQIKLTRHLTK